MCPWPVRMFPYENEHGNRAGRAHRPKRCTSDADAQNSRMSGLLRGQAHRAVRVRQHASVHGAVPCCFGAAAHGSRQAAVPHGCVLLRLRDLPQRLSAPLEPVDRGPLGVDRGWRRGVRRVLAPGIDASVRWSAPGIGDTVRSLGTRLSTVLRILSPEEVERERQELLTIPASG